MEDSGGLFGALQEMFQDFNTLWFIGLATFCYIVIQVLRGKAGFAIPGVTKFLEEKLSKEAKTYLIHLLFGIAGLLTSLEVEKVTFWTLLNGFLAGVVTSWTTNGARNTVKQGIEGIKKMKQQTKDNLIEPD